MALARIRSRLSSSSPAQPPSPMPNSRASSRPDPPFNNYVDKLKNIPEFDLPDDMNRPPIAEVDYRLIKSKDKNSIQQMMESAVRFGVFRVSGHGISPEELQAAFTEAEFCFGLLAERWSRDGDREEFAWSRSAMAVAERRREVKSEEQFQMFRKKMENVANKLEGIAKDVSQIIGSNGGKQPRKKIKENETRMTIFKHNNSSLQPHTPRSSQTPRGLDGSRRESPIFALSLHIPTEFGEFRLLSEDGPFSFRTNPNTIVCRGVELSLSHISSSPLISSLTEKSLKPLTATQPPQNSHHRPSLAAAAIVWQSCPTETSCRSTTQELLAPATTDRPSLAPATTRVCHHKTATTSNHYQQPLNHHSLSLGTSFIPLLKLSDGGEGFSMKKWQNRPPKNH